MRQLSLAVVGVDFPNRRPNKRGQIPRRFEIATCVPGEPVSLVLEPDNPADPAAVMIFSARNVQIGYVAAERAPLVGKHMRQGDGVRAIFHCATGRGALIRVSLDGSEPTLPPFSDSEESRSDGADWDYADPIWPED